MLLTSTNISGILNLVCAVCERVRERDELWAKSVLVATELGRREGGWEREREMPISSLNQLWQVELQRLHHFQNFAWHASCTHVFSRNKTHSPLNYSPVNILNADGYKLMFCPVFILIGDQRIVCFVFIQHTFILRNSRAAAASSFGCLSGLRTLWPPIFTQSELSAEY